MGDIESGLGLTPRRRRLVLVVVALALMTVVSAVSGLNVALPTLARDTGASSTQLTWIVDAYTVVFAGLLLFAGGVGDRFGRRGILLAGLAVFGVAAAVAITASSPAELIGLRAAMGLGAACIMPTTLSVITTSFPEEDRPRAIGVWVGVAGGGAVLGLFVTGLLLEYYDWSSFFALSATLAAIAFAGTAAFVPGSRAEDAPPLDVPGGMLSLLAVGCVVFGIIEGPVRGWGDPLTVLGLVGGGAAAAAFIAWELHAHAPMLDPRLFASRGLSAGTLTIAVQFFAAFGFFFAILQYLQFVVADTPLHAAVRLLPLPVVLIPLARQTPLLADRIGFRRVAPLGLLLMAAGFTIMSTLHVHLTYWVFAVGLGLFAAGMAFAGTPATTAITEALPPAKQGIASAVNDTARELGSAFGIAILGSFITATYRTQVSSALTSAPAEVAGHIRSNIAFTSSPMVERLGVSGKRVVAAADQAFLDGVSGGLLAAAGLLVVAAAVVWLLAPKPPSPGSTVMATAVRTARRGRPVTSGLMSQTGTPLTSSSHEHHPVNSLRGSAGRRVTPAPPQGPPRRRVRSARSDQGDVSE